MRIAMIASEANPLAKSGGLADVVTALSEEYVAAGHEVAIFMPYYRSVDNHIKDRPLTRVGTFFVHLAWRNIEAEIFTLTISRIRFYLIGNYFYFGRPCLYGYEDDAERFAFISISAIELLQQLRFDPDIIHVHDWQTAIIPTLLKNNYRGVRTFKNTHTVLTIHNPAFKGYLDPYFLGDFFSLPDSLYHSGHLRLDGMVSTLKAGIVDSEKITTVSPTHREELLTEEFSQGLCGVLRLRETDFCGIVNGVDRFEFNPEKDPHLAKNYNSKTLVEGKKACRNAFFSRWGKKDDGGPLFGLVSRLTYQKGIDLLLLAAHYTIDRGGYIAILGSGEEGLERGIEYLKACYPDRVYSNIGYSDDVAHEIYAASDFFLMPSLFEPCGIGQLIAEEYGALPVARKTGGLADTIVDYRGDNEDEATGFLFEDYDEGGLAYAMYEAEKVYANKDLFHKLQSNAMEVDNSWTTSAKLYLGIYEELIRK